MKEIFLGTGANGGTPQIECSCDNCTAAQNIPELRRLRSSILVETSELKITLDCGPDFRQQLLRANLKLQDIDLIAITHLHFDHAGGLMELSAGNKLGIPILVSGENRKPLSNYYPGVSYLEESGFVKLISEEEGKDFGVTLVPIPHSPIFPTSAIVVTDSNYSVWYSPDVLDITGQMKDIIQETGLIIFDATFLDDQNYPAAALGHTTIKKSAPHLAQLNPEVIFSHINHSENPEAIKSFLNQFNFDLAEDSQERSLTQ